MTQSTRKISAAPIDFIDLGAQRRRLGGRIERAILRVAGHGRYIMGPEVAALEDKLARFCDVKHCVSCANGTDALQIALMAAGIGAGDAVYVPSFTFTATAGAVALVGATPVFVDVLPDTFNIDPESLAAAIATTKGMRRSAIIAVDLFGQPADYRRIEPIARDHGLTLISDAAQSLGARLDNREVGTLADVTTTSFFPVKPLGCYGDGGAVFTRSDEIADTLRSIRQHGRGAGKYDNLRIGLNSRLDSIQAAILIEKLSVFEAEIESRQRVAARYNLALAEVAQTPAVIPGATSVWANYTLQLEIRDRAKVKLEEVGIPTAVYYPKPLHQRAAYRDFPRAPQGLPVSEMVARKVLSLPMHAYLQDADQDRIIEAVTTVLEAA